MTHVAAANFIRSRFKTLADAQGWTVSWPNAPFIEPETTWLRFATVNGNSDQVTFGRSKRFRTTGILAITIFGSLEYGDGALLAMADLIKANFRSVIANRIRWHTPSITDGGRDGARYMINVACPFQFDDVE